jgi:hypothetical protein
MLKKRSNTSLNMLVIVWKAADWTKFCIIAFEDGEIKIEETILKSMPSKYVYCFYLTGF